jgi:hypothetical protein
MLRRGREIYREYLRERLLSPVRCGLGLLRSNPHDVHPLAWEYKFRLRRLGNRLRWRAVADPFKTVRVSPDEIDRYTDEFGKWESVGLISAGDWDRRAEPIEEEGRWDGCTTPEEVYDRYETMDELYHSIRENGFESPVDVRPERHEDKRFFDYVAVHVGRDGELIFGLSGCHRLSIAKLLDDVEEIPVWIRGRHAGWQRTREAVAGRDSVEGPLRSHPDLQDLIGR